MSDHDPQNDSSPPSKANVDTNVAAADSRKTASSGVLGGPFGIILSLALLATAGTFAYRSFYMAEPVKSDTPPVMYICAETGETFEYKPQIGDTDPVASPHSNKRTGYRAEACYWQKDSDEAKAQPTWVLLNEYAGKAGVTECPDCGRIVKPHNPLPNSEREG